MNDDLVMRLRVATVADTAKSLYQLMTDAADEIERLRISLEQREAERDTWKTTLTTDRDRWREIAKCLNSDDANVRNLGYELYEQAARGER